MNRATFILPKKEGINYGVVTVNKDISGDIIVSFPYDPQLIEKVKSIDGRKCIGIRNAGVFQILMEL